MKSSPSYFPSPQCKISSSSGSLLTLQVDSKVTDPRPETRLPEFTEAARRAMNINHLINILNLREKQSQLRFYVPHKVKEIKNVIQAAFLLNTQKQPYKTKLKTATLNLEYNVQICYNCPWFFLFCCLQVEVIIATLSLFKLKISVYLILKS